MNTLSDTLSSGLINVFSDIFTFFVTLIVMFAIDWQLALWSLVLFPVLIIWVRVLQYFQRKAYQVLSNKQSNLNAFIHESIAGVKTRRPSPARRSSSTPSSSSKTTYVPPGWPPSTLNS